MAEKQNIYKDKNIQDNIIEVKNSLKTNNIYNNTR